MNENKTLSTTKQTSLTKRLAGLVEKISHHHAECLKTFGQGLRHAYECGRLLNEAKTSLARGEYERWVHKNFDFGDRTAQMYKRVFENWAVLKNKAEDMASLSLSQANKLLAGPKPKPASEVADEPSAGEATAGDKEPVGDGPIPPPGTKPASDPLTKPAMKENKPHDTLQALMKKYDLFGEPEMLIELLLALGFAKSEIDAKLEQGA